MSFSESIKPFLVHFNELRSRVLRSLGVFCVVFAVSFNFASPVLNWIIEPAGRLVFTTPGGAFASIMSVTTIMAFVISSPYVLFQVWAFVAGGLRPQERRFVYMFAPLSFIFFAAGVAFAFFVAVPMSYQFLMGFASYQLTPMITVDNYLSFVATEVMAFGVTFELPLILAFLAKIGIATPEFLRQKRRHAIIIILIVAAVLTPPDVVSQLLLGVPLLVLYELGIIFTQIFYKRI